MHTLASPARAQPSSYPALGSAHTPVKPARSPNTHAAANDASNHDATAHPDLWSSILNSVKSSKAVSTKNLVILGEPSSGKSSLLSALASASPGGLITGNSSYLSAGSTARTHDKSASTTSKLGTAPNDLGLAYAYFDVGDEKDRDEIVARVGAYTLHSSQPAYTSLLPFAFPEPNQSSSEQHTAAAMAALASATLSSTVSASTSSPDLNRTLSPTASIDSLNDSLVVILLDWEQPWSFLEQLRTWLCILAELVDGAAHRAPSSHQQRDAKWSTTRVALDDMKERLEAYIRAYLEPPQKLSEPSESKSNSLSAAHPSNRSSAAQQSSFSDNGAFPAPITTVSVQLDGADANPLADGTLTDNLGIPIVVVCTKADVISRLERDNEFKDEQFDYIQQVLRTICMKYGAALFYASCVRPQSMDVLRSYLLHRLFTTATGSAAAGGVAMFGFPYRASTTDRDTLLVPAGWDSWGKIKALREPFDCRSMARGWHNDCEIEKLRRSRGLANTKQVEDQLENEVHAHRRADASFDGAASADDVQSAMKLYEDIVSDWEAGPAGKDSSNKVRIPDEQAFLGQHHAALQKDPDPRSKFSKRGVVGPMVGSSAALPTVEKIMSREVKPDATGSVHTESGRPRLDPSASITTSKRDTTSAAAAAAAAAVAAMTGNTDRTSHPSSPSISPGTTSPGAPKQSEVLHSFFQSLLKDKGSGVGSPKLERLNRTNSSTTRRDPPSTSGK